MTPEQRLEKLGISLPESSNPAANYANAVLTGNLLYLSGKAPLAVDGELPRGRVGLEFSLEQGYNFARSACLDLIAVMHSQLHDLSRVAQIVELQGFVNASNDFEEHAKVLNGASDLLVQVFGDEGVHARSVFGASSLRGNVPVILKGVIEIKPTE
jgi:enamine deaminase RidA (YjgF/YER057c/UK114 family)